LQLVYKFYALAGGHVHFPVSRNYGFPFGSIHKYAAPFLNFGLLYHIFLKIAI